MRTTPKKQSLKEKMVANFQTKEERFIESNCGEVNIQTIYKKN